MRKCSYQHGRVHGDHTNSVRSEHSIPSYPAVLLTQHAARLSVDTADCLRACYVPNCADNGRLKVQRGTTTGFEECVGIPCQFSPPAFHRRIHWSAIDFFVVWIPEASLIKPQIKYCVCSKGKGKGAPLYRHWGSVQTVRPIGGVEV